MTYADFIKSRAIARVLREGPMFAEVAVELTRSTYQHPAAPSFYHRYLVMAAVRELTRG